MSSSNTTIQSKIEPNTNKYGQNIYEFHLYCKECKYRLRNIYDKCKNSDCSLYLKHLMDDDSKESIFEKDLFKEDFLEEYNSEPDNYVEDDILEQNIAHIKIHEYFHNGECVFNKYGQCTKGWKYFCCCEYGIESYYTQCNVKTCFRYKHMKEENKRKYDNFELL
jgi:hypothetical protein